MAWETSRKCRNEFATYQQMLDFLETRSRALINAHGSNQEVVENSYKSKPKVNVFNTGVKNNASLFRCKVCKDIHTISQCRKFKAYSLEQRLAFAQREKLCQNCLKAGHNIQSCRSLYRCQRCQAKHHSLLHTIVNNNNAAIAKQQTDDSLTSTELKPTTNASVPTVSNVTSLQSATRGTVLLATAKVVLENSYGQRISARALLDSGSEATFISERMTQLLRLRKKRVHIPVTGLRGTPIGNANHETSLLLKSHDLVSASVHLSRVLVLPTLTTLFPARKITTSWPHLADLPLADPDFAPSAPVDLILGADVYGILLRGGIVHGPPGTPSAQLTSLGWILLGSASSSSETASVTALLTVILKDVSRQVQRFWEQEEVNAENIPTPEDNYCEELFQTTTYRDESGRYTVRLPIHTNNKTLSLLGASHGFALNQLRSLERRLVKNPELKLKYEQFLADYLDQGHMTRTSVAAPEQVTYYLPHHAVVKPSDPSKKIRVVFNASARTATGYSLNDCLFAGPKLHAELWLVLTRWRLYPYVFTTDIVQMFRQIRIHPKDQDLLRILWQSDEYCLTTVTYGTKPAPYLAIRTLLQLATDEQGRFPRGAAAIRLNTYVDDILAGGHTLEETIAVREQLVELLRAGEFRLSKWAANRNNICPEQEVSERLFSDLDGVPTLGLLWSTQSDSFTLRAVPSCSATNPTKRSVLADVSRFFDPLGWAAPVLVFGKIFIQDCWKDSLSWDQPLPQILQARWAQFVSQLAELNHLTIPRYVAYSSSHRVQLLGFCDASERAYAAVVYLRCENLGSATVNLLVAKTRVPPIKEISMPRLELCGAVLLAKLMQTISKGINFENLSWFLWTDAQVVLHWLSAHPSKWPPYVAHRVTVIQEIAPFSRWSYVNTHSNPADLCTRDITPEELRLSKLWWQGPSWLSGPTSEWPQTSLTSLRSLSLVEASTASYHTTTDKYDDGSCEIFRKFSTLSRLMRFTAWCRRCLYNLKNLKAKRFGVITAEELSDARKILIFLAQQQDYYPEMETLRKGGQLPARSKLLPLRPVLAADGLLRVGGRLQRAELPEESRHPAILSKNNHLSLLLTRQAHFQSLHGGPQLMRSILAQYWIVHGASLAKFVARQCVVCTRHRATVTMQQMGQLPPERVRPSRPFLHSGVDFAGPFTLTSRRGRGCRTYKGWVCLFVCLSIKAIHLEVATDLSSAAFIATFKRFVSRRGHCSWLFSDNATNFRGADTELRKWLTEATDSHQQLRAEVEDSGTTWKFIPPSAPHFGGLGRRG